MPVAKIHSGNDLKQRILKATCKLDCQNIQAAKQGKKISDINAQITEMMFIYEFIPFWTPKQIRQKECLLNEKYNV